VKHKHRRAHFWIALTVLAILALLFWRREMLSTWLAGLTRPPAAGAPRTLVSSVSVEPSLAPIETFRFEDAASLAQWEQKVFKGKTLYQIESPQGQRPYLSALSENSSCGLYMKTHQEATPQLFLSWKWRARVFPKKKEPMKLSSRSQDDFAARVYVIFEASNLFRSDVIEYIWDDSLPEGTVEDSPYSERIKLFVIRSGLAAEADGGWRIETRNPRQDYTDLFGKAPKNPIGILALMCDSDNTGTSAQADFDEIAFGTKNRDNSNGEGSR